MKRIWGMSGLPKCRHGWTTAWSGAVYSRLRTEALLSSSLANVYESQQRPQLYEERWTLMEGREQHREHAEQLLFFPGTVGVGGGGVNGPSTSELEHVHLARHVNVRPLPHYFHRKPNAFTYHHLRYSVRSCGQTCRADWLSRVTCDTQERTN